MTPRLLGFTRPDVIVLEKVDGIPYLDHPDGFDAAMLGKTLASFHKTLWKNGITICQYDNQPKNILLVSKPEDEVKEQGAEIIKNRNINLIGGETSVWHKLQHNFCFIDFSDARLDHPENDVSHLMLFWAEEFDVSKFAFLTSVFVSSYTRQVNLNKKIWLLLLRENIERFDRRRKIYNKIPDRVPKNRSENRELLFEMEF